MAKSPDTKQPFILCTCYPHEGHLNPILSIASHLKSCGYDMFVLTTAALRPRVEETGAEWVELPYSLTPEVMARFIPTLSMKPGACLLAKQFKYMFLDTLPKRLEGVEKALVKLHERDPERQIIIIDDLANFATAPFKYGRPLPNGVDKLPKSIGVGLFPVLAESQDTAPWLSGIAPDSSEEGRKRNMTLHKESRDGSMKPYYDNWDSAFDKLGAPGAKDMPYFRRYYAAHDAVLQLCSPSLEYYRTDLPFNIEFAGVLPPRKALSGFRYPEWWADVQNTKEAGKKIIMVSQGSLATDPTHLIIPSMKALAEAENMLVIVTLGSKDAKLPDGTIVSSNARVIDYIPYDVILPYSDVFVFNAGYGGYTHAVRNGVPVVCAGETEDKPGVTMRSVASGLGMDLKTMSPSPEQVRKGVEKILGEPQYKIRAVELQEENNKLHVLATFERKVKELSA